MIFSFEELIDIECQELASFLKRKNRAYGNSVGDPVMCFSKLSAAERIAVRMDDKISRIVRGGEYPGDDDKKDLLGYLILERVIARWGKEEDAS